MKVHEVDVINGQEQDLDDDRVWDDILIRIRAGAYKAIIVSPPCSTFSRATLNRSRGPPPMRSSKYPWGFPWILGKRRSKLRQANRLVKKAILACAAGAEVGTPYVLEFPEDLGSKQGRRQASIWQLACTKKLAETTGGHRIALYQRWFGTPFLKPTGLLTSCTPTYKLSLIGWPRFDSQGRYLGPLSYEHAVPMALGAENTAPRQLTRHS